MNAFRKATRLSEVAAAVNLDALGLGDPRWVDLTKGRGSDDLQHLRIHLEDQDGAVNRFAKALFTGHRGCGKTTELLRVMHDVRERFTSILMVANEALLGDFDYSDLFLWLVDQLVGQFRDNFGLPLDKGLVKDTEEWFAKVTQEVVKGIKSELTVGAEAEVGAKLGWFGIGLKLLGRLKSMAVGSVQNRQTIRPELQRYSFDLVNRVNLLLDNAHDVLEKAGKPNNLLIVVDNLDRLRPAEVGRRLFYENGDLLKQLRAHVIYTVPITSVLAPINVGRVFENIFTLPMVCVRDAKGKRYKKGIDAFVQVLAERLDFSRIFASESIPTYFAAMSGGSLRDLNRLVQEARLSAKEKIDKASAERAATKLRIAYQGLLRPSQVYYPLLARVHATKQDCFAADAAGVDPKKAEDYRIFFGELLSNGAVMEYDGGRSWYDVHPVIEQIDDFQQAMSHAT